MIFNQINNIGIVNDVSYNCNIIIIDLQTTSTIIV